jgi:EF hand
MNRLSRIGSFALAMGLGAACLSGPAAAQQLQYACDEDGDGYIDASESRACMERTFDELAAGEEALTEQLLSETSQGERGLIFAEADENQDGEISREEWTRWHEQRFAAATQASESGMPTADYDRMEWTQEGYVRPTPEEAGQKQQ